MAFKRVEVDESGQSILYYDKPPETPISVWALRVLVGVLLVSGVLGFIKLAGIFSSMQEQIADHEHRLYQNTEWDFDETMDGRWRYCRENPESCVQPWGTQPIGECLECVNDGTVDLSELPADLPWDQALALIGERAGALSDECPCRDLFTPYGWGSDEEPMTGPTLALREIVPCEEEPAECAELFFDLREACVTDDEACWVDWGAEVDPTSSECGVEAGTSLGTDVPLLCYRDYPLQTPEGGSYGGGAMLNFVGRETLKVMNVTLSLVVFGVSGVILFLIFRWSMVLLAMFKAKPRSHQNLIRTGAVQIVVEIAKIYLIARITAVSYPFANVSDSMGLRSLPMLIALAAIGISLLPSSRRFFSYFKVVLQEDEAAKPKTPTPAAEPSSAA